MLTSEAAARIPDFWARAAAVKTDLSDRRLISLDLRFRNGVTIGIADLPLGWAAAVQKDKDGVFSVQLVRSEKPATPARLGSLLACVTICPDEDDDRDLKVDFLGGDAVIEGADTSEYFKLGPLDLKLTQDVKVYSCDRGRTSR